jgi:flagellar hook-associated protein 3 FlgL
MRIASNSYSQTLIQQLNTLAARQAQLHTQAATGQRIRAPEDDPAAIRRVIDLQAEMRTVAQYQKNVAHHQEMANATFGVLTGLTKISDRAGEIATLSDGTRSPAELAIYAAEINELIKQGVQLANSKNRGDYLFGGTRTDQPPFILNLNANGQPASVTYQGNQAPSQAEIAEGTLLTAQVAGANAGGAGRGLISDAAAGADFFTHLISLRDNLLAGDVSAIAGVNRPQLARDEENIIFHLAQSGAIQGRLEAAAAILRSRSASLESQVSREADADLAQTLVRLSEIQTAYQAALQSGARILDLTLLNFLR